MKRYLLGRADSFFTPFRQAEVSVSTCDGATVTLSTKTPPSPGSPLPSPTLPSPSPPRTRKFMARSSVSPGSLQLPAFLKQNRSDLVDKFADLEWQQLARLAHGQTAKNPPSPWARHASEAVNARNRYQNVEPYAANRVHLRVSDPRASDYINASIIRLGKRRYIATQGPKRNTINHFYRMLAQVTKGPAVVVMLTQTHESGREKCTKYYPATARESPLHVALDFDFGDELDGSVELLNVRDDAASGSKVRHMRLNTSDDSEHSERDIYHLLYSAWPDFSVPEGPDRAALVELIRLSASYSCTASSPTDSAVAPDDTAIPPMATCLESTDHGNPRIIHCSAGVGRTGTFIALDYLLSLLHAGELDNVPPGKDPIADTVDLLRQQRMMMVQSERQFLFLYEVMREQFEARIRERTISRSRATSPTSAK